jgi:hypothetical protein
MQLKERIRDFLISNFRPVLNVVCFLLGNFSAPEFYMPTFRNTLFHLHGQIDVETITITIINMLEKCSASVRVVV